MRYYGPSDLLLCSGTEDNLGEPPIQDIRYLHWTSVLPYSQSMTCEYNSNEDQRLSPHHHLNAPIDGSIAVLVRVPLDYECARYLSLLIQFYDYFLTFNDEASGSHFAQPIQCDSACWLYSFISWGRQEKGSTPLLDTFTSSLGMPEFLQQY